jgi:Zn-finger nucleic acid-binding protein
MNCPACNTVMEEVTVDTVTVDVCKQGCGGIWFDRFELQKADELHECAGELLVQVRKEGNAAVDPSQRRNCPRCENIVMMRHFFSAKREVEVDECPKCGGFWLDYGELGQIRSQYSSAEERKNAAKEYFENILGIELERMQGESEDGSKKARHIASMFRFICPSYYLPGKQDWGAF